MAHLRAALDSRGLPSAKWAAGPGGWTGPAMLGNGLAGCSRLQLMWRWTFSAVDGPGSAGAIQGPGIDGSMMPSSSQE